MPRSSIVRGFFAAILAASLAAALATSWPAPPAHAAADQAVHFPTSCADGVAAGFDEAVELLHSFEYPMSEAAFREVLKTDPSCAMARWGIAMSYWHPLWQQPDPASLHAGAAMLAAIGPGALSEREAGFIAALTAFYRDYANTPHEQRVEHYVQAMEQLHEANRDDPESAAFFALALLAGADPTDKTYCSQLRAAALLNWVEAVRPDHPGALHYLIHAYDTPALAHLGLPAAMTYADVAPQSTHAQHMPSHIFTRLGLWKLSIDSNHHATASAHSYTERAGLTGFYDEGMHSMDYLMYALLQVGDDAGALALLSDLGAIASTDPVNFKVAFTYASSPGRYAIERRDWQQASRLELRPADFPWRDFRWAEAIHHFARGIGAARSGQLDLAQRELAAIRGIADELPDDTPRYWRAQVRVQTDAVAAWIALAEGDASAALRLAAAAADLEDAVDKHPVTPGELIPARELLADLLLQTDQARAALDEYRRVLTSAPNRTNALLGAAAAAAATGDAEAAANYFAQVVAQTMPAGEGLARLDAAYHRSGGP